MLWGKRDASNERATLRDWQDLHEFLERQAQTAILDELNSQSKLTEAESDMEIEEWEGIQNLRCMKRHASEWADQAQRERIGLCGELELRNRLYQEICTRSRQEIEELRRRCNREGKLTQHGLDDFSMQQETDRETGSQIVTKIRNVQDKVNFLSDARDSHDLDSGSSSGHSHVPKQHRIISSSRRRPRCESGVPRNTRDDYEYSRKRF